MDSKHKPANRIESLERALYANENKIARKPRATLSPISDTVPDSWNTEANPSIMKKQKKKLLHTRGFRNMFFLAVFFFVASLLYAGIRLFAGSGTVVKENIDITILGNAFIDGGSTLPLQVKVTNNNQTSLEYADVELAYLRSGGSGEGLTRDRNGIGTVRPGETITVPFDVSLFGEQGSVRDIVATLEYRISDSNTIFYKETRFPVAIASSPITVTIESPSSVLPNQEFDLKLKIVSNTSEPTKPLLIKADYPSGFAVVRTNPETTFRDTTWSIGQIAPGATKEIVVRGVMRIQDTKERVVTFRVGEIEGSDESQISLQYSSVGYAIVTESPFLSVVVNNDENTIIAKRGATIPIALTWKNNHDTQITNAEINVQFAGNIVEQVAVTPNEGLYDSTSKKIRWTPQQNSDLKVIQPGAIGTLSFSVTVPQTVTAQNPTVTFVVSASGVSGTAGERQQVDQVTDARIIFQTDAAFSGSVLYNSGPFDNAGPLPPTPGQTTTYTITLSLTNQINAIQKTQIKGILPIYVDWVDEVSPGNEPIRYNSITREVIWDIGSVQPMMSGIDRKEVSFKVKFNPIESQVLTSPSLFENIRLVAEDVFTKTQIQQNISALTINLSKDSGSNSSYNIVTQ